jgi:hypothetical protein
MSDDLVKRLRQSWDADRSIISQTDLWMTERVAAADRIEELEAENHLLKTSGIAEVAARNPNVMEYMKHWEGRAEAAEAKLAKAVEFISNLRGLYT